MAPTPPVDTGATPTRTPASVGFGPAVAVRVNLLWTATDTPLRTDTVRVSVAVTEGFERPSPGEVVGVVAVVVAATATKSPPHDRATTPTACRSAKTDL